MCSCNRSVSISGPSGTLAKVYSGTGCPGKVSFADRMTDVSKTGRIRFQVLIFLLAAASGGGALLTQKAPPKSQPRPAAQPVAAAVPAADWAEVDRLISEQKLAEALAKVD